MRKIRLGLVGCGNRGVGVTDLFKSDPRCEVTALMDRFPACVDVAAEHLKLPDAARYIDFDRMLREARVDALFFACDPTVQVELACRAMEAGKHVCTEVPAAFTLDECWSLVRTVEKTGMKYQLMEQTRYWGFVEAWRQMRERGELGHVCAAQGEYIHYERNWGFWTDTETGEIYKEFDPPPGRKVAPTWRAQVLADPIYYLPHTLSPLLSILDDRVLRVSCMSTRKGSYTHEGEQPPWSDLQYALMHTQKDTLLLVGAGFSMPHVTRGATSCHWYEVRGTKGSVTSPRYAEDRFRVWRQGMETYEAMDVSTFPLQATAEETKTGHGGADFKPVVTFLDAILENKTPPLDVVRTAELTAPAIVAAESARRGGVLLEVPSFRN